MKHAIKFVFFIVFICSHQVFGFSDSLNFSNRSFPIEKKLKQLDLLQASKFENMAVASFQFESGSNGIPLSMISKFAFGGYISPEQMQNYQSLLSGSNRLGVSQEYNLTLYPIIGIEKNKKNSIYMIELGIQDVQGATFTQDAFRLFFQGNTQYLGQTLNAGNNEIESWRNRILRFVFQPQKKLFGMTMYPSIQFGQCLSYTRVETRDLKLTTDALGDHVDFSGNGFYSSTGYSFGGNGYGIQLGLNLNKSFLNEKGQNTNIKVGIQNFGFYQFSSVNTTSRNAIWNANGQGLIPDGFTHSNDLNLSAVQISASDLKFGNWFNNQKDSIVSKLNLIDSKRRGMVLSPFTAQMSMEFSNRNNFNSKFVNQHIALKYTYVIGYLPKLSYLATFKGKFARKKKGTQSSFLYAIGASVGGFDNFDINGELLLNAGYFRGKPMNLLIVMNGIESYVNPSKWHGAGLGIKWNYIL